MTSSHVTTRSAKNTIIIQMQLHEQVEIAATVCLHNSIQIAMRKAERTFKLMKRVIFLSAQTLYPSGTSGCASVFHAKKMLGVALEHS